ncbi:metallophosphoesterase family protein [Marinovum sp. 2_MG-2023]|uniref:metallophosphoesterase family protein n=1 Tax=unclassified Marinovum TaxID=2647166 RepID=UPI0026E37A2D|nr:MULTISPECIES: metallophosphoesterase family protein [unclassified Marinovum]MDO6731275.1 metallophosphoesterase family protein [Marinovum sp. 2_MG-2023]MDO6780573.1 metallophosphoesterase family protein [Marinovum sp. 1_MG-2023]
MHPAAHLLPSVFDTDSCLADLPRDTEPWLDRRAQRQIADCLARVGHNGGWHWPDRPVVFVSDPHADAEGFLRSLIAAGVIRRDMGRIVLTEFGTQARIILGGDSLDKGPSNLALLDALNALRHTGADVHILAGNHDLRMRMAVAALRGPRDALREHLFVRMGRKILPILREVLDRFVTTSDLAQLPDEAACKARLTPRADWPDRFAVAAKGQVRPKVIRKETSKLLEKLKKFDTHCAATGMSYREILAAALKCHEVFFEPAGAYAWFFDAMDVVTRSGSLLFVHAGLCDSMCALLASEGTDAVNARYRAEAEQASLGFYFGPLANLVRTKYRKSDCQLTDTGVSALTQAGIHMVVQGHVNNHRGQRLLAKRGVLHLEGDITLDRTSRRLEGLEGIGAGATLIFPTGDVIGLSRDYPRAKHFAPERMI